MPTGGTTDWKHLQLPSMLHFILISLMTFQQLNTKQEKDINGIMDQSQVMDKTLFQLTKEAQHHI